jgi:hypothetical protein
MSSLKARVRNGRLVLDEATDLPEGTEIELVPADWWEGLRTIGSRPAGGAEARDMMGA